MGIDGLWWLKVNLANLHGEKAKASLSDRVSFIDENIEHVIDSAKYPLEGHRWWQSAEDPFQALACCKEIQQALEYDNPADYMCHIPIIQDGTCNGLQHYAALGRDTPGAMQVNLIDSDKPQDVYTEVANIVEQYRIKDAQTGDVIAQAVEGLITRKVVKQTVMTIVYGVTNFGANRQIARKLEEEENYSFTKSQLANYITIKIFRAVKSLFTSAREIQEWLKNCAAQISRTDSPVSWETPFGLPVVQPYHKIKRSKTKTGLQQIGMVIQTDETEKVNLNKQRNAFAPNFIHSLDASHMLLTAKRMREFNLTFASVHDSFWTHACDVKTMNQVCREEFVNLHSLPILENLHSSLVEKHGGQKMISGPYIVQGTKESRKHVIIDNLPKKGNLDIKEVLDSTYFFS